MKDNVFKILVVALLVVVIIFQLKSTDVGRYELNDSELIIFDSKTGKIYSSEGIFDLLEFAKEKQEEIDKKDSIN